MNWKYFILIVILFFSCKEKRTIDPEIKAFLGSNVVVNSQLGKIVQGELSEKDYILLLYFKIDDCVPCSLDKVNLLKIYESDWEKFKTGILLVIQDNDKKDEILSLMNDLDIQYPVFFDVGNHFKESNRAVQHEIAQTFVMDKENKVIWIGSPIKNEQTLIRYRKMMNMLLEN